MTTKNITLNNYQSTIDSKKAFTLLELIVVLVILGIFAALAIPSFNKVQQNSVASVTSSTAKLLARDANALGAQNTAASVGLTSATNIYTAYTELTVPSNLTSSWNGTSGSATLTVNGEGVAQTCFVAITSNSAVSNGTTASGSAC